MKTYVIAAFLSIAATSVSAKTLTYDFVGYGQMGSVFSFASEGVSLDVRGLSYSNSRFQNEDLTLWSQGFGMKNSRNDNHQIDGYGKNEFVTFTLSEAVDRIQSLTFDYVDGHDRFAFYGSNGTDDGVLLQHTLISNQNAGKVTYLFDEDYAGSFFGVGALGANDNFKVRGLTASVSDTPSPVPLPASLPLLAFGLVGLRFLSRRKTQNATGNLILYSSVYRGRLLG